MNESDFGVLACGRGRISARFRVVSVVSAWALIALSGSAQTLYERPVAAEEPDETSERSELVQTPASSPPQLEEVSLFYVEPVLPPEFESEDLITIIISERTEVEREQTLETEKSYENEAAVEAIPDLMEFYQLVLAQGGNLAELALTSETEFSGEATYERDDELTARVTARVVEVKPNGVLLIEARTSIKTDEEEQTITLSGYCRSEDVTVTNTVQSNQMYDLRLDIENTGDLGRTAKKGLIPRVLESIFNF